MSTTFRKSTFGQVQKHLLDRQEICILDVREEHFHGEGHPLFAVNCPLGNLELNAYNFMPRMDVLIVAIDNGNGDCLAEMAASKLEALGYTNVSVFEGGIAAWEEAGGILFSDLNVPSKAFAEFVEHHRHTPSLSPKEVHELIEANANIAIFDVRGAEDYLAQHLPTATHVPGAELLLRVPTQIKDNNTQIIVHCAGRTRGIVGAQSLINASLPNPIAALRNGTMGWILDGQELVNESPTGSSQIDHLAPSTSSFSRDAAQKIANKAGVKYATWSDIESWQKQNARTTYFFDLRDSEQYERGHLPGWRSVAGGHLVQETDTCVQVRGARIVLLDDDGVRANMTASWLAQMNWEAVVLEDVPEFSEKGGWVPKAPPIPPEIDWIEPQELALMSADTVSILDFSLQGLYKQGHIPGAWSILRSRLATDILSIPAAEAYVLTCNTGEIAAYAYAELKCLTSLPVRVLVNGNQGWRDAGYPYSAEPCQCASPLVDRYQRPYAAENRIKMMQAYLEWETGLIPQLEKDGTHGFHLI